MNNILKMSVFPLVLSLLAGCGQEAGYGTYLASSRSEAEEIEAVSESAQVLLPQQEERLMVVYVCGEVYVPGVYELPVGSRVCDAVAAAGGLTEAASPDYWNLARLLTDGEMICFPDKEAAEERRKAAGEADQSSGASDGRVNINTATLEQLTTIPGIGETRGRAILAYRDRHGGFSDAEELMQVSGIGNATFENMRDYITVD